MNSWKQTGAVVDLSALDSYAQENAYRSARQRRENNPAIATRVSFIVDNRIKQYVESDLWQTEHYFCLAS